MKLLKLCSIAVIIASPLFAEIKMPTIFSNDMLLQREMPVKIWGKADAGAKVDVEFAGQKKSTKADAKGNWSLHLDKMSANKNPQQMKISENGKLCKTIKNILVGEVWIAGGQSNMEWRLFQSSDAITAMDRAKYPMMRYFHQPIKMGRTPQFDSPEKSHWIVADGKNMAMTSAVGFYFAEKVMKDLDVPVAILYASRGGSKMSCWLPREYHAKQASYKEYLANFEKDETGYTEEVYKKRFADHAQLLKDVQAKKRPRPTDWFYKTPPNPVSPWHDFRTPTYLYNAMVAPIAGYTIRGTIWYQGESDTLEEEVDFFAEKLSVLVDSWRDKFENKDMAFLWVQLTGYSTKRDWATGRWQQLKARDMIKNSGIVNIIDCGEEKEIHPRNKTTVGLRLADLALKDVYGKDVNAYAPEFKSIKYEGDTAIITLETYGRSLKTKGYARGFEVKVNNVWINANASLKDGKLIVKSPECSDITGVRYLWKNWATPDVWLYNEDGLPAFSFINLR